MNTAGEYEVISNESGCVKTSNVNVLDNLPSVDLGSDITLCNPSEATLDAGVGGEGITYEWRLNGQQHSRCRE